MKNRYPLPMLLCAALLAGCATQGGDAGRQRANAPASASLSMNQSDLRLLAGLAQTHIAEIQTGKLALARTQDREVKAFAQTLVDDHGRALQELQRLAESAGLLLPEGTDLVHRAVTADLGLLSGPDFDRQYLSLFGIADQQSWLELLDQTARGAVNAALRAHARQQLPVATRHLERAQQLARQLSAQQR